jgi:hypothetical protein
MLLFTMGVAAAIASAPVEMSIVTNKGFVTFVVGDDWPVVSMQSKLPIAAAAFAIPNPADQGTPDSTNIVLMLYDAHSRRARSLFEAPVTEPGSSAPQIEHIADWTVYRQDVVQGSTRYTILDAKRARIADVLVKVRLAWPHLDSNSERYDADMESTFREFLASIRGTIGRYVAPPDVKVRRPEP